MLQTTGNNDLSTQADQNEKNYHTPDNIGCASSVSSKKVGRSIKNLSTVAKSAKFKKPKLIKPKKSDLIKTQNFARANSFETDFLIFEAKKGFIHLQKAFTEASILKHFDPECHIKIETDISRYAIGKILSQLTSDKHFSVHVTHKDSNSDFPKSEIEQ